MLREWCYDGPVEQFGKYVGNYKATTFAPSEKAAKNNMTYRYKREYGYSANSAIKLTGRATIIE